MGNEVCDNGNIGGCTPTCNGVVANWTCIEGNPTKTSVCACLPGYV